LIQSLKSYFSSSSYPTVEKFADYTEKKVNQTRFVFNDSGELLLSPGDYSIPVMTYCQNFAAGSSPASHVYTLSRMEGKLAPITKKINLKAPQSFSHSQIQMLHWAIQAGLSYDEISLDGREIIDQVAPEYKDDLKESFLSKVEKKWQNLSEKSGGVVPDISQALNTIEGMRVFRDSVREVGYDYEKLKSTIDTSPAKKKKNINVLWSKISENIYARFVTEGSYGEVGFLQVRVIEDGRNLSSEKKYPLDITSLIADPNESSVQPLLFTPLIGSTGIRIALTTTLNPRAIALLLTLSLTITPMDWDHFFELEKEYNESGEKEIQKEIERGNEILRKEHDELEKPLKEAGIISGKTKNTSKKKNGEVKEYTKEGGDEQLQKDFDKLPGEPIKGKTDGVEYKKYSDGIHIVKTPKKVKEDGSVRYPTLEVQPTNHLEINSDIRIKVRYQ
jgi:hypothetical protein